VRQVYLSELKITASECGPGTQIHLALLASSTKEQERLKMLAEKLAFRK
jgi:hypothetical protein